MYCSACAFHVLWPNFMRVQFFWAFLGFPWVHVAIFHSDCTCLCSCTMPRLTFEDMGPKSQERALAQLQVAVEVPLRAPYRAVLQPNGHILLIPALQGTKAEVADAQTAADLWQSTVRAIWRTRTMGLSRTEARFLVPDLAENITVAQYTAGIKDLAQPASRAMKVADAENPDATIHGAIVNLADKVSHMFECRTVASPSLLQPGGDRHHWVTIGVDGTSRHKASYVHCVLGVDGLCSSMGSWWLFRASEKWSTVFATAQAENFDEQIEVASAVQIRERATETIRNPLFFLTADAKAQVFLSGTGKFTKREGSVCWVCGQQHADIVQGFGTEDSVNRPICDILPVGAQMRPVPPERRIPDFGLHGIVRMVVCAINGMMNTVCSVNARIPRGRVAREAQAVLNVSRLKSRCVTVHTVDATDANQGGKIRLEASGGIEFMRTG